MADKNTMLAEIVKINAVDGFDPAPFAVDLPIWGAERCASACP